jgi:hypothetical protein
MTPTEAPSAPPSVGASRPHTPAGYFLQEEGPFIEPSETGGQHPVHPAAAPTITSDADTAAGLPLAWPSAPQPVPRGMSIPDRVKAR